MRLGDINLGKLYAVIDFYARKKFPEDYDSRCLYYATGIHSVLIKQGIKAQIVGGNIGVFTISIDGRKVFLQGFGGSGDSSEPSHYWVETEDMILDPGPSYLPKSSNVEVVSMPMVAWNKKCELPKYIQYEEHIRCAVDAEYRFPEEIAKRVSDFVELCQKRYLSKVAKSKLSTWIVTTPESVSLAARSGNQWAKGALRFQSMDLVPTIPA